MLNLSLVAIGGALGAGLRYVSGLAIARFAGADYPYGTLFVNIVGSFAMGLLMAWLAGRSAEAGNQLRLFLATGVLGGFTTFSAFSLDAILLYERGEMSQALFYVLISVVFSIGSLFAGLWLMRHLA